MTDKLEFIRKIQSTEQYRSIAQEKELQVYRTLQDLQRKGEHPNVVRFDCSICALPEIMVYGARHKKNPKFIKMSTEKICERCYNNKGVLT